MEENKISKKIRVETSSRVCNLAFEDAVNDRLENRTPCGIPPPCI